MKGRRATKAAMRSGGAGQQAKQHHIRGGNGILSAGRLTPVELTAVDEGRDAQLNKVDLLKALLALRRGDFSVRLAPNLSGLDGKIADAFNDVLQINERLARELGRLNHVVGAEGRLS